jgi:hypothetical protein
MVTGPAPQFTVTSASMRAVTRATAGVARRIASWTDRALVVEGARIAAPSSRLTDHDALMDGNLPLLARDGP